MDFGYAFSPDVFGLPFSSRRHIARISYFSYSFAVDIFLGPAYLGYVLFDVQPGPAPTLAQIFSLMHQHWQIDPKYAASSLKSIISVSILTEIFSLVPEIGKVRGNLFQINGYVKEPLILPEGSGPPVIHSEKVYVPVKEHPDVSIIILLFNWSKLFAFQFHLCHFIFLIISHNIFVFRKLLFINIVVIVPQKSQSWPFWDGKKDVFMNPAKVSVHCGKQEAGGGNFLSKLLRKNFEK